jgi:hypothetical protein
VRTYTICATDPVLITGQKTNYDLLISKTPEELAIYLSELANGDCPIIGDCPDGMKEKTTCTPSECWASWLKSPVEEVDNGT